MSKNYIFLLKRVLFDLALPAFSELVCIVDGKVHFTFYHSVAQCDIDERVLSKKVTILSEGEGQIPGAKDPLNIF